MSQLISNIQDKIYAIWNIYIYTHTFVWLKINIYIINIQNKNEK